MQPTSPSRPPRLLVLADDLSGAAELAGIGLEYGLATDLARAASPSQAQLLVIDTDTRLLAPEAAAARVTHILNELPAGRLVQVYKKTDSLLRGQIPAELGAMMAVLN